VGQSTMGEGLHKETVSGCMCCSETSATGAPGSPMCGVLHQRAASDGMNCCGTVTPGVQASNVPMGPSMCRGLGRLPQYLLMATGASGTAFGREAAGDEGLATGLKSRDMYFGPGCQSCIADTRISIHGLHRVPVSSPVKETKQARWLTKLTTGSDTYWNATDGFG
jgi:hypothetical protein